MQTVVLPEPAADTGVPAGCHFVDIAKLFAAHHASLVRFVRRYVRSQEDAEDVAQATFLEAVRCAGRFSGLSKPSTWLFGIALNLAHNHVRRHRARPQDMLEESALDELAEAGMDPSDIVEGYEFAAQVQAVLADLSPEVRETFEAVMDKGWTYEQTAAMLKVPLGTVRSRIFRARSILRTRLAMH